MPKMVEACDMAGDVGGDMTIALSPCIGGHGVVVDAGSRSRLTAKAQLQGSTGGGAGEWDCTGGGIYPTKTKEPMETADLLSKME